MTSRRNLLALTLLLVIFGALNSGLQRAWADKAIGGGQRLARLLAPARSGEMAAVKLAKSALASDTCVDAQVLTVNTPVNDTTLGATNDYQLAPGSACFTANGAIGNTPDVFVGPDVVYTFTAPATGTYSIRVQPTNTSQSYDVALYTSSTCPGGAGVQTVSCATAADRRGDNGGDEIKCQPLMAGQLIYIFVDGFRTTGMSGAAGSYEIEVVNCVNESESNDTPATANALACGQEGSLIPITDVDFYSLGTPATGSRVFAILDGGPSLADDYDLRVTTDTNTLEYDDLNNVFPFGANSPNVAGTPTTGVATYLRVNYFSQTTPAAGVEPYRIVSVIQPPIESTTTEAEPNDTLATASFGVNNYFSGTLATTTDSVDFYGFPATAGDLVYLGLDGDPLRNNTPINGQIALLDSVGTVLVSVNDGGSTSSVTAGATLTSTTPSSPGEGLLYRIRTTGTYYARVMGSTTAVTGDYLLSISKNCQIGGGVSSCPSTLTVNDLGDTADNNPGDGMCNDGGGKCTLRAAIMEANASMACSPLTINFSVTGTINLATALPDLAHPNLTITGPGATNLTVARNSASPFRIFTVSASKIVAITSLKITNGLAPGTNNGGGVHNSGTLNLSQCVISGNGIETTSVGGSGFGGGIYSAGPLTIDRCEVSGNSGRSGAGITHNGLGSGFPMIITNSTISGNTGVQSGGFDIRNTSASLTNCTISGNTAPGRIGGIDQVAQSGNTSSLSLTNCTVANNTGSAAIETFGFAGVTSLTTTLKNTLVAGNVGANFTTTLGTLTSLGNNLDSDGTSGFTNGTNGDIVGTSGSPINARLAPLGNYGGPTQTHALLPGSPAINAGNNCVLTNTCASNNLGFNLTTDQRGIVRPQGANVDIGAVEAQPFTLVITGGNNQSTAVNTAFPTPLQVNLKEGANNLPGAVITFTGPGSGASLNPVSSTATTDANGNASRSVTANTVAGGPYTVNATTGALSQPFSLTNLPGTATQLAFGQQPSNTPAAVPISPAVTVRVLDAFGNLTNSSAAVTLALGANPGGATLSGTTTVNASNGVATFSTLSLDKMGTGYTLVASSAGLSGATSIPFNIACPTITLSGLPGGTAGNVYNQTITASPSGGGYSFTSSGSLPPGLTLSAGGVLSGTPTAAGTFNFTVTATGFGSCSGGQTYALVIACPTISLNPASLPNATINTAYPTTVSASPAGGGYTFAVTSGLLPTGLTLNANGSFSGAPTASGTFNFRITATGFGGCTGFQDYVLTVSCPTITVDPSSLPGGSVGASYSQTVAGSPAGTYSYSVSGGALPTGLTLNASSGAITGTPTTTGSFTFTITATAGTCSGSRNYTVTITCSTITFSTSSPLPSSQAGVAYSQTISISPAGSYTFSLTAGSLPSGLLLNSTTGVISGTPLGTGTATFTVKAQAANGCNATQGYTLAITCPTVVLSPANLPNGTTGTAYSQTISASPAGGNYTFAVSGTLPPGLNLNPSTGVLSGTPTANGSFTFTITATGWGGCTGSNSYTVTVGGGGGCPTITLPASLPNGMAGQLYNSSVAASPAGNYSYTATGSLPPGVTLYSANGLLFGYPTAVGSYTFTITATQGACSGSQTYTVVIGAGMASSLTVYSDFDGDGKSDLSVFRGTDGNWLVENSGDGQLQSTLWGASYDPYNDVTVSGDYDGDGKTDLAVFRRGGEHAGYWFIKRSSDGGVSSHFWGLPTDIPVPGDYDGDGKMDVAVWRSSAGAWYIVRSSDGGVEGIIWGAAAAGDIPVPGDYDGDGKTDPAVFRRSDGYWHIKQSSDGATISAALGKGTDVAVPGDYDGDGKTDLAVWRGSEGNWHIIESGSALLKTVSLGAVALGDVPAVADYDGDGKADLAVWRSSTGTWTIKRSRDNVEMSKVHGQSGDMPIMAKRN